MMILYGDYKDLNYIQDFWYGRLDNVSIEEIEEMEALHPHWEKFLNGDMNLKQQRPTRTQIEHFVRLDIHHHVFEDNEYTSYALILPMHSAWSWSICHYAHTDGMQYFLDENAGVYITESEQSIRTPPTSLEELKQREYKWQQKLIKRMTGMEAVDISMTTEHLLAQGLQNECPEITDPIVISGIVKDLLDTLVKWRDKETQRWFHETAVSC